MFRAIMVPLDGTEFAEQALPVAMGLARRTGARLHLVRVHLGETTDEMWANTELYAGVATARERWRDELAELRRVADEAASAGLAVKHELLEGPVVETLARYVAAAEVDLVVMTTHGRGPLSRAILGSVADPLVHRLKVPTVLVRPKIVAPRRGRPAPTRHLLIALDGSREAETMLPTAVALGESMGAQFTLLRVVDFAMFYAADAAELAAAYPYSEPSWELQRKAEEYLEELAAPLRKRGLNVQTRAVVNSNPAQAILQQAHDLGCDLIALESRGETGLTRLLLGSVEDELVRRGDVNVLTHAARCGRPTDAAT